MTTIETRTEMLKNTLNSSVIGCFQRHHAIVSELCDKPIFNEAYYTLESQITDKQRLGLFFWIVKDHFLPFHAQKTGHWPWFNRDKFPTHLAQIKNKTVDELDIFRRNPDMHDFLLELGNHFAQAYSNGLEATEVLDSIYNHRNLQAEPILNLFLGKKSYSRYLN